MNEIIYEAPERIDSNNAADVQKEMVAMAEQAVQVEGEILFVVDMAGTKYLSSAGLRSLTVIQKKMRAAGGKFVLRNVSEALRDLLDVTGLSGYLPIE